MTALLSPLASERGLEFAGWIFPNVVPYCKDLGIEGTSHSRDSGSLDSSDSRGSVDSNLSLCGDSNRIRQVLLNLAGNAIKFTQKGHVKITCQIVHDSFPLQHLTDGQDDIKLSNSDSIECPRNLSSLTIDETHIGISDQNLGESFLDEESSTNGFFSLSHSSSFGRQNSAIETNPPSPLSEKFNLDDRVSLNGLSGNSQKSFPSKYDETLFDPPSPQTENVEEPENHYITLEFRVQDTGIGLTDAEQLSLFKPFHQGKIQLFFLFSNHLQLKI